MTNDSQLVPVVAYARISADLARDGHGVEDQHRVNDETAATLGLKIVHYYTDNDLSAAKVDLVRPDFEAMLRALKAGHLPDAQPVRGAIVVADDRLVRRVGDYERFVDALTYANGPWQRMAKPITQASTVESSTVRLAQAQRGVGARCQWPPRSR